MSVVPEAREPALLRPVQLKICGLRDPAQAAAIAALGVEAIGVVAVAGSPRFLVPEQRQAVFEAAQACRPQCLGVLVVADPTEEDLPHLLPERGHRVVQLHGEESPQQCCRLRRALGSDVTLWKALRIRSRDDLRRAEPYGDVVDGLLLDAWVADQLGGTGHRIPLAWLEGFSPSLPWWLAGGISPETVETVLQSVHPWGLDASSGVEDRPGWKRLDRVGELLERMAPVRRPAME